METELRRRRGNTLEDALNFQLAACVEDEGLAAMVLADTDGLPLASWGQMATCEEVAAGAPFGRGGDEARTVRFGSHEFYLCAVGGKPQGRRHALTRSANGVSRILGQWIAP